MSTLNCDNCRKHWSPFADGELDAATQAAVQAHLRTCPACQVYFAHEDEFEEGLRRRLGATYMPDELWAGLTERVRSNRRMSRLPVVWPLALAASLALVAVLGVYSASQPRHPSPGGIIHGEVHAVSAQLTDMLQAARPSLERFDDAPQSSFAEDLSALGQRLLGQAITLDPHATGGHALDLVSAREAVDALGNSYIEVRVNCCGRPVLLAIALPGRKSCIRELQCCMRTASEKRACRLPCGKLTGRSCEVASVSIEREGVRIAAAAADHDINPLLNAIHLRPS